jgi:hypothetical protein
MESTLVSLINTDPFTLTECTVLKMSSFFLNLLIAKLMHDILIAKLMHDTAHLATTY